MWIFLTFYTFLRSFIQNDASLFPDYEHPKPGPVVTEDGIEEWKVDSIIDRQLCEQGYQFLVQ